MKSYYLTFCIQMYTIKQERYRYTFVYEKWRSLIHVNRRANFKRAKRVERAS